MLGNARNYSLRFVMLPFLCSFRVMTSIVFNSVPLEDIAQTWGANPAHDRVKAVIREIKRSVQRFLKRKL